VVEVAGEKNVMGAAGNTVLIHYNPQRPSQFYYGPACQLASRALLISVLTGGALAILLTIYMHR
jgi:hypothetical protein